MCAPKVTVFKSDETRPEPLEDSGESGCPLVDDERLAAIHAQRMSWILDVAAQQEVDVLVLEAFGCGASMSNPFVVARVLVGAGVNYHALQQALES